MIGMKQRITIDQFTSLKVSRTSELEIGDGVLIVQRSSSTNDPNYCICSIQDGKVIGVEGYSKFIIETTPDTQVLIDLNRGLSRWEFSKNYKYETFLVKK